MKNLFLSYAKADAGRLALLHDGIEALHHNLWMDRHLDAGHVWWEDILEQIRNCDAMIVAVSPALLESEAASRERTYARQLGKPLLPVMVAEVKSAVLPADLATIQFVDLVGADQMAGFRLSNALATLPPAPPLPEPLPDPPLAPISYMSALADAVRGPDLSLRDQIATVAQLRSAMERPKEQESAVELLTEMAHRRDLFAEVDREIRKILGEERPQLDHPDRKPGLIPDPPAHPPQQPRRPRALALILAAVGVAVVLLATFIITRPSAPESSPLPPAPAQVISPASSPTPSPTPSPTESTSASIPTVFLDYTEGPQGQIITMTGFGFLPSETLTVYYLGAAQGKVQADTLGGFQASMDTTYWPCDFTYEIRVEDILNNILTTSKYTVYCSLGL